MNEWEELFAHWRRQCMIRAAGSYWSNKGRSVFSDRFPKHQCQCQVRPVTSEMICRADVICNASRYHIFLIGGYQFPVFLIDSSNRDTLSAVYSSLTAGQTLLKCQYLLFFLELHFQKDCNSFEDTSTFMHGEGQYKLNLYFIILYPCSGHRGSLTYQPGGCP